MIIRSICFCGAATQIPIMSTPAGGQGALKAWENGETPQLFSMMGGQKAYGSTGPNPEKKNSKGAGQLGGQFYSKLGATPNIKKKPFLLPPFFVKKDW